MNHHDNIAVCDVNEAHFVPPLETYGDKLSIPHTVAHYISPQVGNVSSRKQSVAEIMKSFGMDVIPILGEEFEDELGLILEHEANSQSNEFEELVDEMKQCLHQLGWNYDGWVGEVDQPNTIH